MWESAKAAPKAAGVRAWPGDGGGRECVPPPELVCYRGELRPSEGTHCYAAPVGGGAQIFVREPRAARSCR